MDTSLVFSGLIPIVFSIVAVVFSFLAYQHAKDRFRLDLLEKRWEIYQEILQSCSIVLTHGGLPKHGTDKGRNEDIIKALQSAHKSFRGIGHHKMKSLFGPEIYGKMDELNKAYAFFVTGFEGPEYAEKDSELLMSMYETTKELPELFKPYVYFGDYKIRKFL